MKLKYNAKMRFFLFLLVICITAGACSYFENDRKPEEMPVPENTNADPKPSVTAAPSDEEQAADVIANEPAEEIKQDEVQAEEVTPEEIPAEEATKEEATIEEATIRAREI